MAENRCVCCGEVIPEGVQVCRKCALRNVSKDHFVGYAEINKIRYIGSGSLWEMVDWAEKQLAQGANDIRIWVDNSV